MKALIAINQWVKRWSTLMFLSAILILGVGPFLLALAGCSESTRKSEEKPTIAITEFPGVNYLYTVPHDGHKFVVLSDGNHAIQMMHHPDCCKTNKPSE